MHCWSQVHVNLFDNQRHWFVPLHPWLLILSPRHHHACHFITHLLAIIYHWCFCSLLFVGPFIIKFYLLFVSLFTAPLSSPMQVLPLHVVWMFYLAVVGGDWAGVLLSNQAKCCTLCLLFVHVCLSVHLFAYLYLSVSTLLEFIFQYRIGSTWTVCPSTPNYWRLCLYSVFIEFVCLSVRLSICIIIGVYFPIQNRLELTLNDCLPCWLLDSMLLLLPPMAELSYQNIIVEERVSILYSLSSPLHG